MSPEPASVRPIDFARDRDPLASFLGERDQMRLEHMRVACEDGDCFAFVAEEDGNAVGWAVVHTKFRSDQDWEPADDDTRAFQSGENAYLENIEVTPRERSGGVGRQLLEAVQAEAKQRGKRTLWLHTAENNVMAHRLFDREGWTQERTVYPEWRTAVKMRIYKKVL